MKSIILALAFVALLGICVSPAAEKKDGVDVAYFTKLRMDYAKRPDYDIGWDQNDERKAVIAAFKDRDFKNTTTLGESWLSKTPIDAEIHLVIALAQKQSGDLAGYCQSLSQFYGLLRSITSSGDGRTPETAFKVIAVAEEYFLLRDAGARVKSQALVGKCDKMVVDLQGEELVFYFDVSISLAAEAKALGLK